MDNQKLKDALDELTAALAAYENATIQYSETMAKIMSETSGIVSRINSAADLYGGVLQYYSQAKQRLADAMTMIDESLQQQAKEDKKP